MTPNQVEEARRLRTEGASPGELADRYGVHVSTIRRHCRGITPPRGGGSDAGRSRASDAETAAMWREWTAGLTQAQIAQQHGMSQQAVSQRLTVWAAAMPATARETLLAREISLLDELRRGVMTVFADTSQPASIRLAAADRLLKGAERLAKMTGLDAAADVNLAATVRYEIVGVDAEAHT